MKNAFVLAALAALAASPVLAQEDTVLGQKIGEAQQLTLQGAKNFNSDEARSGRVLSAIACGGPAVEQVIETIDAQKVRVRFERRQDASALVDEGQGPVVSLNEKLPDAPRVLVLYVANEVSKLMFDDMPECAEKYYMRESLTAQSWLELGGDATKLPVIDGSYRDERLGAAIKTWAEKGSERALEEIGQQRHLDDLPTLMDKEKDPAKLARLKEANRRFTDFMISENQFRELRADQLKNK